MSSYVSSPTHAYSPPLQYDPQTNEPYLPLPPPLGPQIRLTPPRYTSSSSPSSNPSPSDLLPLVIALNSPLITPYLTGPPHPFTPAHAHTWLAKRTAEAQSTLSSPSPPSGCPVRIIRERLPDGTDAFLGDCFLARSHFPEIADEAERARRTAENESFADGDGRIVYSFGMFLSPAAHSNGIMSAVVSTLITSWAIPVMRARRFQVAAMSHNVPSQKVFLKNGFTLVEELPDVVDLEKLGKGEGKVGLMVFRREIEDEEVQGETPPAEDK